MPSTTFNTLALFASGPHRVAHLPIGEAVLPNGVLNPVNPGSTPIGPMELEIEVRGRLIAASEAGLWSLRDAIGAQLTHPPTMGTLEEASGRSWSSMSFVRFTVAGPTDHGRTCSIAYTARFVRFL